MSYQSFVHWSSCGGACTCQELLCCKSLNLSIWCRSVEDANGPFRGLRECASASPEGSAAGMDDVQVNIMSAQPVVPMIWPGLVLQCIMIATDLILTMMRIAASCMHSVRSSNAVNAQPHQCFAQISWCSHNLTSCLRALHQEYGKATLILYATTCAGCVVH